MKTQPITPEQLARLFPNASKSLLAANNKATPQPVGIKEPVKPRRATEPNKTEREFEAILRAQFPDAIIRWEAYTLRLASKCSYSPDYSVLHPGPDRRLDFYEVKGAYIFPKALSKPRMCAQEFDHKFFLAQKSKGEWRITEFAKRG